MFHVIRVPSWGLTAARAEYYGYRWGLHLGPWLVFVMPGRAG